MLSEQEAIKALKKLNSDRKPEKIIVFNDLYIILAPGSDLVEGNFDPFYSVNMETGIAREYSIFQDGKAKEILVLFEKAPML